VSAYLDCTTKKIHVMPDDNAHTCHPLCPCGPYLYYLDDKSGGELWGHHRDNTRMLGGVELIERIRNGTAR
jgi:hypothetical protein